VLAAVGFSVRSRLAIVADDAKSTLAGRPASSSGSSASRSRTTWRRRPSPPGQSRRPGRRSPYAVAVAPRRHPRASVPAVSRRSNKCRRRTGSITMGRRLTKGARGRTARSQSSAPRALPDRPRRPRDRAGRPRRHAAGESRGLGVLQTGEEQFDRAGRDVWISGGPSELTATGGLGEPDHGLHRIAGDLEQRATSSFAARVPRSTSGRSRTTSKLVAGSASGNAGRPYRHRRRLLGGRRPLCRQEL